MVKALSIVFAFYISIINAQSKEQMVGYLLLS